LGYHIVSNVYADCEEDQGQDESENDGEQFGSTTGGQIARRQSHRKCAVRYGKNSADCYHDCPEALHSGVAGVHSQLLTRMPLANQ